MKINFPILITAIILAGCGDSKSHPASRLQQPSGEFSFVTPDGWSRTKLNGVDFIVVSGEPDFGTEPNLFVDLVASGSITDSTQKVIAKYRNNQRSYKILLQKDFVTDSGMSGTKITSERKSNKALPLASFHYLIQDSERVIAITASCADAVKEKYEPIFDEAMKSLESEKKNH